ncbi:MAG: 1,2-phenylacetyl-CoA epoxidase subunit PaaD [Nocardioidaceae bacterium]
MTTTPTRRPVTNAADFAAGRDTSDGSAREQAWRIAASVLDPEVPVVTIEDLGILRDVAVEPDGGVLVTITPTYSGCPAMEAIRNDILDAFAQGGQYDVRVEFVLAPAWTTDWISGDGRRKLEEFGIAPPPEGLDKLDHPMDGLDHPMDGLDHPKDRLDHPMDARDRSRGAGGSVLLTLSLRCPQCGSPDTRELSRFGSTACKSLWVCNACREPFDHFKAI